MRILLYIPVKESYTQLWEYYKNDRDILEDISTELYYSNNFISFLFYVLKADYIYCWWWHKSILQIIIAKLLGKKVVCTGAIHMFDYSGSKETFFKRNYIYRLFIKISLSLADANLFLTNDQKKQITSHIKVNNPLVVYSSLEKKHLDNHRRLLKNKNYSNKTIIASTLWLTESSIKRKGLFEILEALELLNDQNFIFYIIGKKGNGYNKLINKVQNLKINNKVKIFTDVTSKKKFEILETANLYLQPSHYEGLGNAVIEAMSRGCVPLVSRFSSQPEVIGEYGFIVNEINRVEIAKKISQYLTLSDDEKNELRIDILNFVNNKFSYDLHSKSIKDIFNSLN